MRLAVEEAVRGLANGDKVNYASIASNYAHGGVTRNTLRKRAVAEFQGKALREGAGRPPLLGDRYEAALADWIRRSHSVNLSPTAGQLETKAIRLASRLQKKWKGDKPSHKWFKAFMRRHNLSLRKPTGISGARRSAELDADAIKDWFKQYQQVSQQHGQHVP